VSDFKMNFCSDNVTGVAPEIMAALVEANRGAAWPYGNDDWTRRVEARLCDIFERKVRAFPVLTGTAANALALATMAPPYGAILAHENAHVMVDECGAPEFYSGGAKMISVGGAHGKMTPELVAAAIEHFRSTDPHQAPLAAISLTNTTESGTVYHPEEVRAIAELARAEKMRVHMDGARFANAVAALGVAPKAVTWEAGVDALSFGATKAGCMAAECVVFFDETLADSFEYRRMRAGHLASKMRFVSAQLNAFLADGLWLKLAGHANAMAQRLAQGLTRIPGTRLIHPVEASEIFVVLPAPVIAGLRAAGAEFYDWKMTFLGGAEPNLIRLVTAWDTDAAKVERFLKVAAEVAAKAA
jgi:threonine aldolase